MLGRRLGEDGAGPDVGLHGQPVEVHLLGRVGHEGRWSGTKLCRGEGVHRLGGSRGLGARVVLDGPCGLLAVAGGLVGGQAGEGVVALLGEEGVVGVCVDDGAGGGAVDKLAMVREVGLPDGGVGREDALGAGGGRHEDGGVEDVGVHVGVVEEDAGFPVDGAECAGGTVEVHGIGVGVGEVHGGLGGLVAKYRCGSGTGGVGLPVREWLARG